MFHRNILQRYMPKDKALQVVNDEGFYFRRIDAYPDDPTEGDREVFGQREQQILDALNGRQLPESRVTPEEARQLSYDAIHREKQGLYIQSWFWHERMSLHMWEAYGGLNKNPDCALFTVDLLKLSGFLVDVLPVGNQSRPVQYVQDKNAQRDAVFTKQEKFARECEYRALINLSDLILFNKNLLPELNWPTRHTLVHCEEDLAINYRNRGVANEDLFKYVDEFGFILKAPLPELMEAVYIPAKASDEFSIELDGLLALKGHAIRCQRVDLPVD